MIRGACVCGAVTWRFEGTPSHATACSCTACRRYGTLWAYDYERERIFLSGVTSSYVRGDSLGFHFCPTCGCVAFWRALRRNDEGRLRVAVNLRLAEPEVVATVPVEHFDGFDTFQPLPRDGRCVRDYWF